MNSEEKEISYKSTNSYSSLNALTAKTKYIWFVCHGLGYLSRYFLKYFKELNPEDHYIIAPQAPSKYYLSSNFKHVGASWLTKENTERETENNLRYFDAILEKEPHDRDIKMIVLGYSQGVSVALRYIAKRELQCDHLVIHSGSIPKELTPMDFEFFKGHTTLVYGNKDAYLTQDRIKSETKKGKSLFGKSLNIIEFDGVHEVNKNFINTFL